eukprot:7032088-Pyramimonas_sp.AAC.1
MIVEMCKLFERLPRGPVRYLANLGSKRVDTTCGSRLRARQRLLTRSLAAGARCPLPTAAGSALNNDAGRNADAAHAQPMTSLVASSMLAPGSPQT